MVKYDRIQAFDDLGGLAGMLEIFAKESIIEHGLDFSEAVLAFDSQTDTYIDFFDHVPAVINNAASELMRSGRLDYLEFRSISDYVLDIYVFQTSDDREKGEINIMKRSEVSFIDKIFRLDALFTYEMGNRCFLRSIALFPERTSTIRNTLYSDMANISELYGNPFCNIKYVQEHIENNLGKFVDLYSQK